MPPFSNALFYPTIDIRNSEWLKTAVLFWDSISTIVPETINNPYQEYDTQYLRDEGFLKPLRVNQNDASVIGIEDDLLALLSSPETIQEFLYDSNSGHTAVHRSKFSYRLEHVINEIQHHHVYAEKLSRRIQNQLESYNSSHDFYYLNDDFASFYMTALANKLCENHVLAMITDTVPFFVAGNTIKYGSQSCLLATEGHHWRDYHNFRNRELAHGLLLSYIIRSLSISPNTSLDELIRFKNHHRDELGRFKAELANLTKSYDDTNIDLGIVQNEIEDIYKNHFLPAYNDFTHALSGFNIQYFADSFVKVASISASTTSLPMLLLGLPAEHALLAGTSISVIASTVKYCVEKREKLRNSPYSYLLSVKHNF